MEEEIKDKEKEVVNIEEGVIGPAVFKETMSKNFLLYAVSVLVDRALPSVDGLKPVQRRILLSMNDKKLTASGGTSKCAGIVGDTMGNYHPHGDSSIYGALVNMVQDFTMRVPLVDGQGSFGSIDGDPPAAMRYTEARMTKTAETFVTDLHAEILADFMTRNFDDSKPEPMVLPVRFPNLLINGGTGIAVGMATTILPHNPQEIMDLCSWRLANEKATVQDAVKRITGPDFPTGGIIVNDQGLKDCYLYGKGKVTALAKAHIEPAQGNREKIVITQVPWMVNKGDLLQKIAKQYADGKFAEMTDMTDLSKGDHDIRVEITLKRDSNSRAVLQRLLRHTGLRRVYGVEMNCLVRDKNAEQGNPGKPKTLNLLEIIDEFLDFRRYVVIKRAEKRIKEIDQRLYRLEALLKVIGATDKVVQIIKKSKDRAAAKPPLMKLLQVDEQQAQWIVEMQLGSLTQLDSFKLKEEEKQLKEEKKGLEKLIKTPALVTELMNDEFKELKEGWKKEGLLERQTSFVEAEGDAESELLTVPAEDCILLISEQGRSLCGQGTLRRGASLNLDDNDKLLCVEEARTDQERLVFTSAGKAYRLRLADLPLEGKKSRGKLLSDVLGMTKEEKIVGVLDMSNAKDSVLLTTREGMVKRLDPKEFKSAHASGILAAKPGPGDEVIYAALCPENNHICVVANHGKAIRFEASQVRLMGRTAGGIRSLKLPAGNEIIGVLNFDPKEEKQKQMLLAASGGFAKRVPLDDISSQNRGGGGIVVMKTGGKYGEPIFVTLSEDKDELWIDMGKGNLKLHPAKKVPKGKRATMPKRWPGNEKSVNVFSFPAS